MEVLKKSQEILMWFGICPIDDQTNHRKQLLYKLFGWSTVLVGGLGIVSSLVPTFNYGKANLNDALYAAYPIFGSLKTILSLISMMVSSNKVILFFEKLQTFRNNSK